MKYSSYSSQKTDLLFHVNCLIRSSKNLADDILKYFSYIFPGKGFDILCKLSPKETGFDISCKLSQFA